VHLIPPFLIPFLIFIIIPILIIWLHVLPLHAATTCPIFLHCSLVILIGLHGYSCHQSLETLMPLRLLLPHALLPAAHAAPATHSPPIAPSTLRLPPMGLFCHVHRIVFPIPLPLPLRIHPLLLHVLKLLFSCYTLDDMLCCYCCTTSGCVQARLVPVVLHRHTWGRAVVLGVTVLADHCRGAPPTTTECRLLAAGL
jgi:hypothetical protein